MIKLYCENKVFGEYTLFDAQSGESNQISKNEFEAMRLSIKDTNVFWNNSETHTIFPRIIYFQITRKCNLKCPYCFISADQKGQEVPWEDIKILSDYFEKSGIMEIRLTGGEPTLHSHFQEIVNILKEKNIYVSVATNGCWNNMILDFFKTINNIFLIISLDGSDFVQDTYRSNSFETVISNLGELRKYNRTIKVRINTVLTQDNYLKIEDLFVLAREYNVEYINFIPLKPQLRSSKMKDLMLNSKQYEEAVQLMVNFREKYEVKFNTSILTTRIEEIMKDKLYKKRKHCSAGMEGTNLDYDFEKKLYRMYGCAYSPAVDLKWKSIIKEYLVAGEFSIEEFEKLGIIWNDDKCWKIFRSKAKPLVCNQCKRFGNGCVGACIVQNLNYKKLEEAKDIDGELMKQLQGMQEYYCK